MLTSGIADLEEMHNKSSMVTIPDHSTKTPSSSHKAVSVADGA